MGAMDFRGRTALVTGASAGIGRDLARVLGREVGALVLVARRRERLDALAAELTAARPGLRVVVLPVDLLDRGATGAALDALSRDGERVDLLVNNAGLGHHGFFHESEWPKVERMLELNVVSATYLLHRLVPGMVARGSGAVLNVGSLAGFAASPRMGAYSATKAYVNLLSEALSAELAGTGVRVTALCPGPVPTEFQEVSGSEGALRPKVFWVDSMRCAEDAVEALRRGRARVVPGLPTRALAALLEVTPTAIVRPFLSRAASRLRGG
jgi:uncharacterized protein